MKKNPVKTDFQPSEEIRVTPPVAEHDCPEKISSESMLVGPSPDPLLASQMPVEDTPRELASRMIGARVSASLYEYFMHQCDIHDCSPSDAIRRLVENWGPEISFTCRNCGCRFCISLQESQPISDLYAAYRCPKCGSSDCARASR